MHTGHGLVFSLWFSLVTGFISSSSRSSLHPVSSVHAVTDPMTLLSEEPTVGVSRRQPRRWSSSVNEKNVGDNYRNHQRTSDRIELNELNIEKMLQTEEARVQFQGLTTTTTNNKNSGRFRKQTLKRSKISSKSRSSTMPGYSIPSNKQQANAKALTWLEDQTGDDMSALQTPAVQRKRKRASGDAMYQASSSVPDSLMQFAKELHQVRDMSDI
jgi:hypothetical protein